MIARDILTLSLVLLAFLSTVNLALASFNYVEFFPSLASLGLQIESLSSVATETRIDYAIDFLLENPSRYQGLQLKMILIVLEIHGADNKTVIPYGSIEASGSGPLPSHSSMRLQGKFLFIGGNAERLRSLSETVGVRFVFESTAVLRTLLEPAFGLALTFACETDGSPVGCRIVSTDITAYGSGPVGGGV